MGWTLKELASATGLSVAYLSDLERHADANPTLETLTSLADALECDRAELIGGEGSGVAELLPRVPEALSRFLASDDFEIQLQSLAAHAGRELDLDFRQEVVNFLRHAPRRSSGDLRKSEWKQLLNAYIYMVLSDR